MSRNDNYIKNYMIIFPNSIWIAIFTFCPLQQFSSTHVSCSSNVTKCKFVWKVNKLKLLSDFWNISVHLVCCRSYESVVRMLLAIINMLIIIIMLQLLIFIVHFMCFKLPIPTSLVERFHLTRFHMETMGCFNIEQLHQWRFLTVYYRYFPPVQLKSRSLTAVKSD